MKSKKESAYPTTTLPELHRSIKNKRITKLVTDRRLTKLSNVITKMKSIYI